MPLIGRERELQVIGDLVRSVPDHGSGCLIRGEAGSGKSELMAAAAAVASERGMTVLACAGVESEANLPYAGLHQAFHPVISRVKRLPRPQRAALETAFGIRDEEPVNEFIVALAALNLLAEMGREAPVALLADEAEWLDAPTAKALAFIARRLQSDPILLLASLRSGSTSPLLQTGLPEITLEPLRPAVATALLEASGVSLAARDRRRILRQAAGNPLALVELPRAVGHSSGGRTGLPGAIPLTRRLLDTFAGRVALLPESTQNLLLVAALNDGDSMDECLSAGAELAGSDPDPDGLRPATIAGLVAVEEDRVRFRHPLVRSAIHERASLADRRRAHAALAAILGANPDRRVWHLAASTLGTNEEVAEQLTMVADKARRRAAVEVASAAMLRAAQLTPEPQQRALRLLQAARLAFELGDPDAVASLLAEARQLDAERTLRWQVTALQEAREEDVAWDPLRVRSLLQEAELARAEGDRAVSLELLRAAALRCWWSGRDDPVRQEVSSAADRLRGEIDGGLVVLIAALSDPFRNARRILASIPEIAASGDRPGTPRLLGTAAAILGAWDTALPLLRAAADGLRTEGRLALVVQMQVTVAFAAFMTGDWKGAMGAASEGLELAEETAQPRWACASRIAMAAVAGLHGNITHATELLDIAEPWARQKNSPYVLALASWARGLTALGSDAPEDALVFLSRILDPSDPGYHLSVGSWAAADVADAAVSAGRPETLLDLSVRFTALAAKGLPPTAAAGLAYAAALAAADADAEGRFERALELSGSIPFLQARVRLGYGAWLRRQRRIRDARPPLIAAQQTFVQLGAARWAARAREELRATGRTRRTANADGTREELTPQEYNIAQLASAGFSNREIGERLFLSPRTVGSHLYRLYPKLGVTSRVQLRDALAARGTPAA